MSTLEKTRIYLIVVAGALIGTMAFSNMSQTAWALTGRGASDDEVIPGSSVAPLQVPPPVDCTTDSGDIVAIDTSNGKDGWAGYETLAADLESIGKVLRTFNLSTDGIPSCINIIFITSVNSFDSCLTTPYNATEATQIRDWVSAGGKLALNGEWGAACGVGTAPVINAFNETWNGDFNFGFTPFDSGVNYDPDNPAVLWNGVNNFTLFAYSTFTATAGVVAQDDLGMPIVIAETFGEGCLVKVGDSDWNADIDNFILETDNEQLAVNIFKYLQTCVAAPPVGGEIMPLSMASLFTAGLFTTTAGWALTAFAAGIGASIAALIRMRRRKVKASDL